jgi:hypothetical protein
MMQITDEKIRTPLASARTLSELAQAASEITEVQLKLLHCELLRWRRQVLLPALLLISSLAVVLSCVPLLLLSVALASAELAVVPLAWSLLVVAGVCGTIGGVVAIFSWLWIRTLQSPLRYLQGQLLEDVRWLKSRFVR